MECGFGIPADDGTDVRIGDKVTSAGRMLIAPYVCHKNVDKITRAL